MKTLEQIKIDRQNAISRLKSEKQTAENLFLFFLVMMFLFFGLGVILSMTVFWWIASLFLMLSTIVHGMVIKQQDFFIEMLEQLIEK